MMNFDIDQPERMGSLFSGCFGLTEQPVCYAYRTGLAFCSREPCRSFARQLAVGQPVTLNYEPCARRIAVTAVPGCPAGYLYAQDAAFLAILFDYLARDSAGAANPAGCDSSSISTLETGPDPARPQTQRMRYPKAGLNIRLALRHAWPLFTVITVLHLKDETLPGCADLTANPWLQPFADLRQGYRKEPYDAYQLPELISRAWLALTAA